jgi:phage gp36-like protein
MYATPARYCAEFGLEEVRVQLLDEGRVLTADLLRQVLDVVAGGTWPTTTTTPERVVAMAAHDSLQRKLGNVSTFIDGYLRSAVTLPVSAGDPALSILEECCLAIARDELANDSDISTELIVKRADRWRKWLIDVSNKVVQLAPGASTAAPVGSGKVVSGRSKSRFKWGAFGGGLGGGQ